MSIFLSIHEVDRIERMVEYAYADEHKHYCEYVCDYNDEEESERVDSGAAPSRKYKDHIFYDLFYMRRAIERIKRSATYRNAKGLPLIPKANA